MWLTADSRRGSDKRGEDKYHLGTVTPFCVGRDGARQTFLHPLYLWKASLTFQQEERGWEGHWDAVFRGRKRYL